MIEQRGIRHLVDFANAAEVIGRQASPKADFLGRYRRKPLLHRLNGHDALRIHPRLCIHPAHTPRIERIGKDHPHTAPHFHFHSLRKAVEGLPLQLKRQYHLYVPFAFHIITARPTPNSTRKYE